MARDNQEAARDWMRSAMTHAGMSQADLARLIWGDDRSVPNKILRARRDMTVDEIAQIEHATGYVPFVPMSKDDPRPLRPPPPRAKRKWHIAEWRKHTETSSAIMAKALGLDEASYGFLEAHPHKFTMEHAELAVKKMKIKFDDLWFAPPPIERVEPTRSKQAPAKVAKRK